MDKPVHERDDTIIETKNTKKKVDHGDKALDK